MLDGRTCTPPARATTVGYRISPVSRLRGISVRALYEDAEDLLPRYSHHMIPARLPYTPVPKHTQRLNKPGR